MRTDPNNDEVNVEPIFFAGKLLCHGCKKHFCHGIRNEADERFCKNCFGHRYGLDEMIKVSKLLDKNSNYLWEVSFDDMSEEERSKLTYVVKPSDLKHE